MSRRYKGAVISATPPTTTGGLTGTAPGAWTLQQQMQAQAGSVWPTAPVGFAVELVRSYVFSTKVDSSGNMYVLGQNSNNGYAQIEKYNSAGAIQWQKSNNKSGSAYASRMAMDSSGNIYFTGLDSRGNALLFKITSAGAISFQKLYNGWDTGCCGGQPGIFGIALDASGNIFVSFSVWSATYGYGYLIGKFDTAGTPSWGRFVYGGISGGNLTNLATDSSGNVYGVSGYNAAYYNAWLVKYNSSGTIQWQKTAGKSGCGYNSYWLDVATDSSGNPHVVGYTGTQGIMLAKYDSAGTMTWGQKMAYGGNQAYGMGIAVDSSGNVYVVGTYLFTYTMVMLKYNSSGTLQWQREVYTSSGSFSSGTAASVTIRADNTPVFSNTCTIGGFEHAFSIAVPADGSGTGTITMNGVSYIYRTSSGTDSALSVTLGTGAGTSRNVSLSTSTPAYTMSDTGLTTGFSYI